MDISKGIRYRLILSKCKEVCWYLAILFLPTNLFWHTRPSWSYLDGVFLDYWAPKLPASVLAILGLWVITLLERNQTGSFFSQIFKQRASVIPHFRSIFRTPTNRTIAIMLAILVVSRQMLLPTPWPSLFFLTTTIAGPGLFLLYLWRERRWTLPRLPQAVIAAGLLQTGLAWYQISTAHPVFPYWILGEPRFSSSSFLATSEFAGAWRILPYGSAPHPNVLAGWMLVAILAVIFAKFKRWPAIILTSIFGLTILATESWTAIFSLAILLLVLAYRARLAGLLERARERRSLGPIFLAFLSTLASNVVILMMVQSKLAIGPSFTRRSSLLLSVLPSWRDWIVSGAGVLQQLRLTKLASILTFSGRFLQPVHSSLLSLAVDLGFCTVLLLSVFSVFVQYSYSSVLLLSLGILPIFSLDHFAITTTSGQFSLVLLSYFLLLILDTIKPISRSHTKSAHAGIKKPASDNQ